MEQQLHLQLKNPKRLLRPRQHSTLLSQTNPIQRSSNNSKDSKWSTENGRNTFWATEAHSTAEFQLTALLVSFDKSKDFLDQIANSWTDRIVNNEWDELFLKRFDDAGRTLVDSLRNSRHSWPRCSSWSPALSRSRNWRVIQKAGSWVCWAPWLCSRSALDISSIRTSSTYWLWAVEQCLMSRARKARLEADRGIRWAYSDLVGRT